MNDNWDIFTNELEVRILKKLFYRESLRYFIYSSEYTIHQSKILAFILELVFQIRSKMVLVLTEIKIAANYNSLQKYCTVQFNYR